MISKSELIESRGLRAIERAIVAADDLGHTSIRIPIEPDTHHILIEALENFGYGAYLDGMGLVIFWS